VLNGQHEKDSILRNPASVIQTKNKLKQTDERSDGRCDMRPYGFRIMDYI